MQIRQERQAATEHDYLVPVHLARMPAYVVPFTVLASIFCRNRASLDTMAAVRCASILSVTWSTWSTSLSSYSVMTYNHSPDACYYTHRFQLKTLSRHEPSSSYTSS